ncbi:ABC transporter substrate-binding protein [bacterium]|nr:ABC transporter substrate-binding protein [bacterium]
MKNREWLRLVLIVLLLFLLSLYIHSAFWRAMAFGSVAALLVFFHFLTPLRVKPFEELKEDVEKMSEGDLRLFRSIPSTQDERMHDFSVSLLVLNAHLRQIVDKMKNVGGSVGHASEQVVELSRTLLKSGQHQSQAAETASEAMSDINHAIIRIAEAAESLNALGITASSAALQLTASIEEVTRNALQVGTYSKDTQLSMQSMVHGMQEMDQASNKLISASHDAELSMQNMHFSIKEVTKRAAESQQLAERASAAAKTGSEVVDDVVFAMKKIAEAFESAGIVIANLAKSSEQIGEILNVITQVADQTNLLSLNAAILSAQAGVHGRGFAVVSDEIRKLSNRTSASVQEIEKLISRVRVEMKDAVQMMEAGKSRLNEGLEQSGKASEALSDILETTSTARERVAAIAEASLEQIKAETEVQQATATIQDRVDQITRIIQEQTKGSHDVYSKAEQTLGLLRNVEKGMKEQTHGAKEVSNIVEHLSGIIQDIHRATSEQSVTSSQVVRSVHSLKNAVQSSTVTIRTLNASAVSLDQESFILKDELSKFRLPEPKKGGVLDLCVTTGLSSLDPAYGRYVYLVDWIYNIYEGLVEFGEGTDLRPSLAERWEVSEDALTYMFWLKKGVRFHNGKEMHATDVRDSFLRVLHPALKTPGTWVFEMVQGAEEYMNGSTNTVDGFNVLDRYTFRIRLREPLPFFLGMLAQCYAFVLPSELTARTGVLTDACGTGPFKLDRLEPDRSLEMSRFHDYHAQPMPYVDSVSVKFGVSEPEISEKLKSGKIHFSSELQKRSLDHFLSMSEWRPRLQTNVQLYTSLIAINSKIPPLTDVRVRQAISYAIDRQRIVHDVVGVERGVIARSLLPPGLQGYDPHAVGYLFDPSRARSLLKQANVPEGTVLEMLQTEAGTNQAVLQIIQENLKDVGLEVRVQFLAPDLLQHAIEKGKVPMRMTKWVADYPDPDNFLYVAFHSKNPAIYTGFQNADFDSFVEEARLVADIRDRVQLYQRAEKIWMEECPCVVLFHNRALVLHQENVHGCIPHFTQPILRLKKIWLS